MFTMAAINDSDSGSELEPLAPSKEAQEFHLSEKYHEGLQKIIQKEYAKARELLEEVLKDPLLSNIQVNDNSVNPRLRELRFLCLKNLADVFLKLGPDNNESAMQCFLQAVDLDFDDVVLWNKLGTLSCSMGLLGQARLAFEQGVRVSPTNSICLEKLMEVLIAIGDSVQCLGASRQLLKKYPGHSRALHVKNAIEGIEMGSHGFNQLEPKHPGLKFKRKSDDMPTTSTAKIIRQDIDVQLTDATWSALVEKTYSILTTNDVNSYHRVILRMVKNTSTETDCMDVKETDNTSTKEKDASTSTEKEQQSYERCSSTRLQRIGRQKTGKDSSEFGKGTVHIFQDLEQFMPKQKVDSSSSSYEEVMDVSMYTPEIEASHVKLFLESIPENCDAFKLGSLLLEEIAELQVPYGDYFIKLPELERMTRPRCQKRSYCCHMYLAEVCFDLGSLPGNEMRHKELLSHSNYHFCMINADAIANEVICHGYSSFWTQFYWIFGCLDLSEGKKERARENFDSAISYLKGRIFLPHCKNEKWLTLQRIARELYSVKLDLLFRDGVLQRLSNVQCVIVLPPLLLSSKDVKRDPEAVELEVYALGLLIPACEKEENLNLKVYLESHKRKLQLLAALAGMDKAAPGLEIVENLKSNQIERIVGAIRDISRSTDLIKSSIDKSDSSEVFTSLVEIIAETQSLLLTVMRSSLTSILAKRAFTNTSEDPKQIESNCLVDAAISFCKLQHLDPSITIKAQVDLIVTMHDLLADCGLCCAGKDNNGKEGAFLKFAIYHLLALDAKFKSLHSIEGIEESSIDSALNQSIFCLHGLNMNPDSTSQNLTIHKNTGRGDYNTKEHCADVFQYILPYYAKEIPRSGLVKLRRVLRAIYKQFPHPPYKVLSGNAIEKFLDGPDSCENKLLEIYESNGGREAIMNILFPDGQSSEALEKLSFSSSEPYLEVYSNLYYFIAQAEDTSAAEKYAGFVLQKEGEDFVEQNCNLLKYDLLYNPLRFDSWQKLANIYDEEVDLLLNDGSRSMNTSDWRKNTTLHERVQAGRRHSRRCLLISLTLASTTSDECQINELLALGYYDILHNAVPIFDQRSLVPTKDATWLAFCQRSMKHFEKAFALGPEWLHALYLGKLCEKLGHSAAKAFWYYTKARELNPASVDPFYRLHASRLKLLYNREKQSDVIQIIAAYAYEESTKEAILAMLGWETDHLNPSKSTGEMIDLPKEGGNFDPELMEDSWHVLYDDCLLALRSCVQGELKHFHKARYRIAHGLYRRGGGGDLERARDELSFCFKSSRSSFLVNMWEIDATGRKGSRKNTSVSGSKISLKLSLSESSRKYITCIRKYLLLYLNLLERTVDLFTLERAYTFLRTDKRFSVCIGDLVPVGLGKYFQVLASEVGNASDSTLVEQLLGKMFTALMEYSSSWADIGSLQGVNCPELSEINLVGYIHQYIQILESELQLEQLETINGKIQKRFKNPEFSINNLSEVHKHASFAWCRCLLIKLASVTPVPDSAETRLTDKRTPLSGSSILCADLRPDELLTTSRGLDMNWFETLARISNLQIRQVPGEKMEEAINLMRCCYNFYREKSTCETLPSGVKLYTVLTSGPQVQEEPVVDVENIDIGIPDKLLLWAYALVSGQYCNISAVVEYCEEKKLRRKKGLRSIYSASPSGTSQPSASSSVNNTTGVQGGLVSVNVDELPSETSREPSTAKVARKADMASPHGTGG